MSYNAGCETHSVLHSWPPVVLTTLAETSEVWWNSAHIQLFDDDDEDKKEDVDVKIKGEKNLLEMETS